MSNKLFEIKFAEDGEVSNTVHLLRVGDYNYKGRTLSITASDLKHLKSNFDKNVLKTDIMVDYSHKSQSIAAGWFKEVSLSDDGKNLSGTVEWTPKGNVLLSEKEYRYASVDFEPDYTDNETGEKFGVTLKGAALTNRPFMKGLTPVVMSEDGAIDKNPKKLDDIKRIINDDPKKGTRNMDFAEIKKELVAVTLSDADKSELMRLTGIENNDVKLSEEIAGLKVDLATKEESIVKLSDEIKTHEQEKAFAVLLSENKAVPAQKEAFMANDMAGFAKGAVAINLSASGTGTGDDANKEIKSFEDAGAEVIKLTDAKMLADKDLDLIDATSLVLSENKTLADILEA